MRKRLKSGDLLQIPLPNNMGFAYAKYLDLVKEISTDGLPNLIKVYDYKTNDENYNFSVLENSEFLIAPLFVTGLPPTVRKGIWKILDENPSIENFSVPHFSRHEDWARGNPDDNWYYCIDADIEKKTRTKKENVQHLSPLAADGTGIIEIRIAMTFLIKEGEKVEDYFALEEYYEKSTYRKVTNTPPYYSLPKDTRDFALTL